MAETPMDAASAPPAPAGQSPPPEAGAAPQPGADATTALQAENAALQDRVLRALAEADNTRRRATRDLADERRFAVTGLARALLPVLDNLRRAIVASDQPESQGASLIDGVRATERLLMAALEGVGVQRVDARGAPFDPLRHEAMMEVDDPATPPGTVHDVMEDGYVLHDRLLRPARVTVTRRAMARDDHDKANP
ncbi:nucleotide exchange factor GrpE [Methylobacterium sp. AMS5]|uniref:nucleotide exchange factor GrpE n=1 Tax=Methylobacterium sp. AMS5 TaxID=925818 RepID=UPI00074F9F98|nr:nucleotide exchange factor GrpE [Methylobacterium sp. AMS5]AMB43398.1 heat shock protein GrpE [Methylobacterium sp. AMS5]